MFSARSPLTDISLYEAKKVYKSRVARGRSLLATNVPSLMVKGKGYRDRSLWMSTIGKNVYSHIKNCYDLILSFVDRDIEDEERWQGEGRCVQPPMRRYSSRK